MKTLCAECHKLSVVEDCIYVIPISLKDLSPAYIRAWVCEDCQIIHWSIRVSDLNKDHEVLKEYSG